MHTYKQLEVWNRGIEIASATYRATKKFPKEERFGMISQMRRCVVSIISNIAEGAGRSSDNEFRHFLSISFGSCPELETQLIISYKLKYLTKEEFEYYHLI